MSARRVRAILRKELRDYRRNRQIVVSMAQPSVASALLSGPELLAQVRFTPLVAALSIWAGVAISTRSSDPRVATQLSVLASRPPAPHQRDPNRRYTSCRCTLSGRKTDMTSRTESTPAAAPCSSTTR
jgi:hypothetical protein